MIRANFLKGDRIMSLKEYKFDNGYGASVVCNDMSYGGKEGLFEIAVIKYNGKNDRGKICYDTPITNDVIGYLTKDEVESILKKIESLKPWR